METKYKDFRASKFLSYDIETYDPKLKEYGSGEFRGDGYVLGFSLADESGFKEYYNLGHPDCTEADRKKNLAYLKETLVLPMPKVGVNIPYDINWTEVAHNIKVAGTLIDIINAEALLDENLPSYSLDSMAKKYFGIGKSKGRPEQICEAEGWTGDFRTHLWKMNYADVREYGCDDALLPIKIFMVQQKLMDAQELRPAFDLECTITRMICDMHQRGVRIDTKERDRVTPQVEEKLESMQKEFYSKYGTMNLNSPKQVQTLLESQGAVFTAFHEPTKAMLAKGISQGSPILDAVALDHLSEKYPVCLDITRIKKLDKMMNTFLKGSLVNNVCPDGRIHTQFYNTKTENEGALAGTRSGRFSCASPNLQQIPSYDKKEKDEYKKWYTRICRSLFLPEENCLWGKLDYAGLELRTISHYAINGLNDTSADDVREAYNNDPEMDFHSFIQELTGLMRRPAKAVTFGKAFGMGLARLAYQNNWTEDFAREVTQIYDMKVPFMKATMKAVMMRGKAQGYIKLIDGRRCRLTDPKKAYIMFNRLAQGTGAVVAKQGMASAYKAGIFSYLPLHLQVHDELDVSIAQNKTAVKALRELQWHMENATKLRVPLIAPPDIGPNWADLGSFESSPLAKFAK